MPVPWCAHVLTAAVGAQLGSPLSHHLRSCSQQVLTEKIEILQMQDRKHCRQADAGGQHPRRGWSEDVHGLELVGIPGKHIHQGTRSTPEGS